MHCRKATQLISEGMDRPLTRRERVALRFHLMLCTACKRYRRQTLLIRNALRQFADWMDEMAMAADQRLSPEAKDRIRRVLADRH